jgi:diaminopimelate decarboxylase
VWLRVNPGFGHGHSRKTNTGGEWSKHGIWHAYLDEALRHVEKYRLDLVGLHMHIGSGADFEHLQPVCDAMVEQVRALGVDVRAISAAAGCRSRTGPATALRHRALSRALGRRARRVERARGHRVSLEIEPAATSSRVGRARAEVRADKRRAPTASCSSTRASTISRGRRCTAAYHAIDVLAPDGALARPRSPTVVAGPLCESGDVFTQEDGGSWCRATSPMPRSAIWS